MYIKNKIEQHFIIKLILLMMFVFVLPQQLMAIDTDGDGIEDSIDLDNDNDGILDLVECPTKNIGQDKTSTGYVRELMQCTYHGCIARTVDGYVAYGQEMSGTNTDILTPTPITPSNGYTYTGDILLATIGSKNSNKVQLFVLSTDGLFVQHDQGAVVKTTMTSGTSMEQIPMPTGVIPSDVKIIQAGYRGISILTKDGTVWTAGADAFYGDGITSSDANWHQVTLSKQISSIKTTYKTRFAYAEDGTLYTWGGRTYTGDGSARTTHATPNEVVNPLPAGVEIVQIGLAGHSYFVLGSNGKLYSLGDNTQGQLGINSTVEQKSWQIVKSIDGTTNLENVVFISGTDNDAERQAMSVVLDNGQVLSWGENSSSMLGVSDNPALLPQIPAGSVGLVANYVENGGHLTPFTTDGEYCNVGHNFRGGFGDGTTDDRSVYSCSTMPVKFLALEKFPSCDDDNDGIKNYYDLDSDNDGIPDNVEAQLTNGYIAPNGTVDTNGTDTAYSGGLTPVDTDEDNVTDMLDLDSDDDGIFDIVESGSNLPSDANGSTTELVGVNGLANPIDNNDTYADVNGKVDTPKDDLMNSNANTPEVDYRKLPINANDDSYIVNGSTGGVVGNIDTNDTFNGSSFTLGTDVNITDSVDDSSYIDINLTNGEVSVRAGTPAGTYVETYTICENLNPTNCDDANVTVVVLLDSDGDGIVDENNDRIADVTDETYNGIGSIGYVVQIPIETRRETEENDEPFPITLESEENPPMIEELQNEVVGDKESSDLSKPVTINVLENDKGEFDETTVQIELLEGFEEEHPDAVLSEDAKELVVPNQGIWTVNEDGTITYESEEGTPIVNPTPISYSVETTDGRRLQTDTMIVLSQNVVSDANIEVCETYEENSVATFNAYGLGLFALFMTLFALFFFRKEK